MIASLAERGAGAKQGMGARSDRLPNPNIEPHTDGRDLDNRMPS